MIPDLSKSVRNLIEITKESLSDPTFLQVIAVPEIESFISGPRLYWNLGHSQGYVVVDTVANKVYRLFEIDPNKETLNDNSLCDPSTAQIVLNDIIYVHECIADQIAEEAIESFMGFLRDMDDFPTSHLM